MFGACHQFFLTLAVLMAGIIGLFLPKGNYQELRASWSWRFAYAGSFLFSLIQMVMLLVVYRHESPPFYVSKGHQETVALSAMTRLWRL